MNYLRTNENKINYFGFFVQKKHLNRLSKWQVHYPVNYLLYPNEPDKNACAILFSFFLNSYWVKELRWNTSCSSCLCWNFVWKIATHCLWVILIISESCKKWICGLSWAGRIYQGNLFWRPTKYKRLEKLIFTFGSQWSFASMLWCFSDLGTSYRKEQSKYQLLPAALELYDRT